MAKEVTELITVWWVRRALHWVRWQLRDVPHHMHCLFFCSTNASKKKFSENQNWDWRLYYLFIFCFYLFLSFSKTPCSHDKKRSMSAKNLEKAHGLGMCHSWKYFSVSLAKKQVPQRTAMSACHTKILSEVGRAHSPKILSAVVRAHSTKMSSDHAGRPWTSEVRSLM